MRKIMAPLIMLVAFAAAPVSRGLALDTAGSASGNSAPPESSVRSGIKIAPPAGTSQGIILNQEASGKANAFSGNYLSLKDGLKTDAEKSSIFWNMDHQIEPGVSGHRTSLNLTTHFTGRDDGSTRNPYYVSITPTMDVMASDGGASPDTNGPTYATGRGAFFVMNPILKASSTRNVQELSVQENNISCDATCSVAYKSLLALVPLATDKTPGRQVDDLITLSAQPGAVGARVLINISSSHGAVPFNQGSTVLKAAGGRLRDGVDLRDLSISGQAFSSPGFAVDGAGRVTARAIIEAAPIVPLSSSSACVKGERSWDSRYEYRCVLTNHWKRSPLSDF